MKNTRTAKLCISAVLIALATALSFVKIINMPWGGSVTLLSMLPIAVISIHFGIKAGVCSSFIYACIQLLFGITMDGLFAWGLTVPMLLACILLDYIIPFTAIGLSGLFRNKGRIGALAGTALAIGIRFICHIISGVVIFASAGMLWEGFATDSSLLYIIIYNGCYMLPEMVLTMLGAFFLYKSLEKVLK